MQGHWTIPPRSEVRKRAAEVRSRWTAEERAARRGALPPDSELRLRGIEFWGPCRRRIGDPFAAPRRDALHSA